MLRVEISIDAEINAAMSRKLEEWSVQVRSFCSERSCPLHGLLVKLVNYRWIIMISHRNLGSNPIGPSKFTIGKSVNLI